MDALCYDLADFIDAVAVCTCATQTFACLAVLETGWQLKISRFLSTKARVSI
jgi:hypothetical protein